MYARYVPNALTLSRFPLAVIFLVLHMQGYTKAALGTAIVCCVTDYFDGKLARAWNVESDFGRLIDPYADKWICWILTIAVVSDLGFGILLVPFIPVIVAQIAYDGGLGYIRWVWGRKNIPTNSYAKWKTTALMTGLVVLYFDGLLASPAYGFGYLIGIGLTWIAIYYALRSCVTYVRAYGWRKFIPLPLYLP